MTDHDFDHCEDLDYKPSTVEQAKFQYSRLGKFFNKQLEDKKEGLLKRLKNIEDKSEKQLKEIKNQRIKEFNDKDSKTAKSKSSLIYDNKHSFYK